MTGTLYLIPNTLGVCEPVLPDALSHVIPRDVQRLTATLSVFVAENAKSTRAFLKLVAMKHPLSLPLQEIRIDELNVNTPEKMLPGLLAPLLNGQDVGLISDAGVPAVADPGATLVRLAHQHGIKVTPMVGPSSLLLAVMASGLNGQSFAFNGYLPVDAALRCKRVRELELRSGQERQTQIFIETPYRNQAMLDTLAAQCKSDTLICVATDLTLPTESIKTLTASHWKKTLAAKQGPDLQRRPSVFLLLSTL